MAINDNVYTNDAIRLAITLIENRWENARNFHFDFGVPKEIEAPVLKEEQARIDVTAYGITRSYVDDGEKNWLIQFEHDLKAGWNKISLSTKTSYGSVVRD